MRKCLFCEEQIPKTRHYCNRECAANFNKAFPGHRLVMALHVSGHSLVATALRCRVSSVRLFTHRGRVKYEHRGGLKPFERAAIIAAGILAEPPNLLRLAPFEMSTDYHGLRKFRRSDRERGCDLANGLVRENPDLLDAIAWALISHRGVLHGHVFDGLADNMSADFFLTNVAESDLLDEVAKKLRAARKAYDSCHAVSAFLSVARAPSRRVSPHKGAGPRSVAPSILTTSEATLAWALDEGPSPCIKGKRARQPYKAAAE